MYNLHIRVALRGGTLWLIVRASLSSRVHLVSTNYIFQFLWEMRRIPEFAISSIEEIVGIIKASRVWCNRLAESSDKAMPDTPANEVKPSQNPGTRRVTVDFADGTYAALEKIATERGVSIGEVLQDAIQLQAWIVEAKAQGTHVLLERNGHVRELALP